MTASWGLLLLLEPSPWRLWLLGSTITIEKRIIKRHVIAAILRIRGPKRKANR
jgi:hypothetical protein